MLKMTKILGCSVMECEYNMNNQCHTMGITVGSPCPMCDTFIRGMEKAGDVDITGGVGACHQQDCSFNQALECNAPGIRVGHHSQHADCDTYSPRQK